METIRHPLSKLRNTYPEPVIPVHNSYIYDNGAIRYSGIYPDNFIKFQVESLDNIKLGTLNLEPTIGFRFIVRFMFTDGTSEDWTSSAFLTELQQAQKDNNPFVSPNRITVAKINYSLIVNYCNSDEFIAGEDYAEVKITKTIGIHKGDGVSDSTDVKESILRHVNWIVNSDEKLRTETEYGAWVLETNQHNLGFPSDPFAKLPDGATVKTSPPLEEKVVPVMQENITAVQNINPAYISAPLQPYSTFPFQTGGNYTGEVRIDIKTGVSYEWIGGKWVISKYVI